MAFSSLQASIEVMRSGNESQAVIANMNDTELQNAHRPAALQHLKSAVMLACLIPEKDTVRLDEVADANSEKLSLALAYLQLYLIFQDNWAGSDSIAAEKVKTYRGLFNELRNGFASMRTTENISPVRSSRVQRG